MHIESVKEIVAELQAILPGRFFGKLWQLSSFSMAIDFGLKSEGYLLIDTDPAQPRLHLIKRTVKELEKSSLPLSLFGQALRTHVGGGRLIRIQQEHDDRIVSLAFSVDDELGDPQSRKLIAQLTGRSANAFLLNSENRITHAIRAPKGAGQQIGEIYAAPPASGTRDKENSVARGTLGSLSEALDKHYRQMAHDNALASAGRALLQKVGRDIARQTRLRTNLRKDIEAHGEPSEHKRLGDLLLANISSARRLGNKVYLQNYFAEGAPEIEVEVDENSSLQDAANDAFLRYSKSKRAIEEIVQRLRKIDEDLHKLQVERTRVEAAIEARDEKVLHQPPEKKTPAAVARAKKDAPNLAGLRQYRSTDGYDVIVGRSARDNDRLTFKVAKPNDIWLHAADYPGSHVVVRSVGRKEIPHRTIIEAAQLAAKFSQASNDAKVTIHYTQRKFVSKPKGAASGLVRLSNFKSMTVVPGENVERIK